MGQNGNYRTRQRPLWVYFQVPNKGVAISASFIIFWLLMCYLGHLLTDCGVLCGFLCCVLSDRGWAWSSVSHHHQAHNTYVTRWQCWFYGYLCIVCLCMFYSYLLIALCLCIFYTLSFIHAVIVFISDVIFIIYHVLMIERWTWQMMFDYLHLCSSAWFDGQFLHPMRERERSHCANWRMRAGPKDHIHGRVGVFRKIREAGTEEPLGEEELLEHQLQGRKRIDQKLSKGIGL